MEELITSISLLSLSKKPVDFVVSYGCISLYVYNEDLNVMIYSQNIIFANETTKSINEKLETMKEYLIKMEEC